MYRTMIEGLLQEQEALYAQVCAGEDSAVCYCPGNDPEYGTFDKNYVNRLRLSYYLLFCHKGSEDMIRRLFEEEVQDRETNSFQGIGSALEVLTSLLHPYNTDGRYDGLFQRAKEANFDCACGYTSNKACTPSLDAYSLDDCIILAGEMDYPEAQARLVDVWKEGVTEWTAREYQMLIEYNKDCGREAENAPVLEKLLELGRAQGSNRDILAAWRDLIAYDVKFARWEDAYAQFEVARQNADLSQIAHLRFFCDYLELCMDIICGGAAHADALWSWARPYVMERSDRENQMYGNLYKKCIAAADAVGDPAGDTLRERYAAWMEHMCL